jgi:hypothetical protein
MTQVDQFNAEHTRITEWIEINDKEIDKTIQLSTLNEDNDKLKTILNTGINLQNDLKSLEGYLQTIDLIIQEFELATENTDDENSIQIFKQRLELLLTNYSNFLKRCKQISDQSERHMILFNEINQLNEEFLKSMNEFDQDLIVNGQNQTVNFLLKSPFIY